MDEENRKSYDVGNGIEWEIQVKNSVYLHFSGGSWCFEHNWIDQLCDEIERKIN
jgi:hypothetical protein